MILIGAYFFIIGYYKIIILGVIIIVFFIIRQTERHDGGLTLSILICWQKSLRILSNFLYRHFIFKRELQPKNQFGLGFLISDGWPQLISFYFAEIVCLTR